MKKVTNKMSRVNSEVKREISDILQNEVTDYRIHPMTTVVRCEVTPDLGFCRVFVTTLENIQNREETLAGLKNAAPFIRHQLAVRLNLRQTPELRFIFDDSLEKALEMERLIDDVIRKDEASHAESDPESNS